jgi:SAM-dependent MidA family methyltransferase
VAAEAHPLLSRLPAELLKVLPDGFTIDFCSGALDWWAAASRVLGKGALVAIDYGMTSEEFFLPHRLEGTLRAYRSHQVSSDVLANPGEQDITAHVDFSLLQQAGEKAGLRTEAMVSQLQFLTAIVQRVFSKAGGRQSMDSLVDWTRQQKRQFRTLTSPEGLGRFRVLVQSRDL